MTPVCQRAYVRSRSDILSYSPLEPPAENRPSAPVEIEADVPVCFGGDDRIRTGDQGFADPCLATWPRRPNNEVFNHLSH